MDTRYLRLVLLKNIFNNIAFHYLVVQNGSWGDWGFTTTCSVTCGIGKQTRGRSCNRPTPANGGSQCLLSNGATRGSSESRDVRCNKVACPGKMFSSYY